MSKLITELYVTVECQTFGVVACDTECSAVVEHSGSTVSDADHTAVSDSRVLQQTLNNSHTRH